MFVCEGKVEIDIFYWILKNVDMGLFFDYLEYFCKLFYIIGGKCDWFVMYIYLF